MLVTALKPWFSFELFVLSYFLYFLKMGGRILYTLTQIGILGCINRVRVVKFMEEYNSFYIYMLLFFPHPYL